MTPATRLRTALDDRLDGLPSVPPQHYLVAGRAAGRRRRQRRVGAAAGLVIAGVLAAGQALPLGDGPQHARERDPNVASVTADPVASLSSLRVEPGVGGIDSYTTDDIPEWATEYGNHGPAAIAPDGRLWIAPEATVVRSIDEPFGDAGRAAGVSHSYAVEVRWERPDSGRGEVDGDGELGKDGLVWSFVFQQSGVTGTFGELASPELWTADFAVWAEDKAANFLGHPRFAEGLARFAGDRSAELVPGAGVEIVRQTTAFATGDLQQHARQAAAEVEIAGQTWFVLAMGKESRGGFYAAYDVTSVGASDFDGFLRFVEAGLVPQGDDAP